MSKRGYEAGAALVGFDIVVPSPVRKAEANPEVAAEQPAGSYEDSWYRTLRVMSGSEGIDDVERTGALGETAPEQPTPAALTLAPAPSDAGETEEVPYVAPQKSEDSYEDSWYKILKGRQDAGLEH